MSVAAVRGVDFDL